MTSRPARPGRQAGRAPSTPWPAILLLVAIGVIAAAQLGKIPPIVADLQRDLGIGLVAVGWTMSVITLVAFVLGLSAGSLLGGLSIKRALLGAMALGAVASAAGALVDGAAALLVVRTVEGVGYLVVTVACPALIARNAGDADRPLALALWACFVPLGLGLMNQVGPMLVALGSWRLVFWAGAALLAVAALLLARTRVDEPAPAKQPGLGFFLREHLTAYGHLPAVAIAAAFFCFAFLNFGFLSFLPTYLETAVGMAPTSAGTLAAVTALAYVPGALLTGALLRRGGSPAILGAIGFAAAAACAWFVYVADLPLPVLAAVAILLNAATGMAGTVGFAAAPRCAPDADRVRLVTGLLAQFSSAAILVAPPTLGAVVESAGWLGIRPLFLAVAVVGIGALWVMNAATRPRGVEVSDAAE